MTVYLKFNFLKRYIIYSLLIFGLISLSGCGIVKRSKAEKAEVNEDNEIAIAAKELKARQKAHYKMQPRDTKKMMKRSKKKVKKLNRPKITL